jgi:arginine deiminase
MADALAYAKQAKTAQASVDAITLTIFDMWFGIGYAIASGMFTAASFNNASNNIYKAQVSKVGKVMKAMHNRQYANMVNANKFVTLNEAYEAAGKYVGKVKTSRKKMSKAQKFEAWASMKTLSDLRAMKAAIDKAIKAKAK